MIQWSHSETPKSWSVQYIQRTLIESHSHGERAEEEVLDYDRGFVAGSEGKEPDDAKSIPWQMGWAEAQE